MLVLSIDIGAQLHAVHQVSHMLPTELHVLSAKSSTCIRKHAISKQSG